MQLEATKMLQFFTPFESYDHLPLCRRKAKWMRGCAGGTELPVPGRVPREGEHHFAGVNQSRGFTPAKELDSCSP